MWLKHPEAVYRLLTETAAHGSGEGMAALAKSYLATTGNQFQLNTAPPRDSEYFLVLGHVLNADATPKPELIARLESALYMSKANPTARFIVSGGGHVMGVKESEVMKRWLADKGVAAEQLLVESTSKDTVENITMSTAILAQKNARRVCLVTGLQGAKREACLLRCHLKHTGSKITATHLAPEAAPAASSSQDALALERFLLFIDLGRILDIWKYRDWNREPA